MNAKDVTNGGGVPDRRKPGRVLSDKLAELHLSHVQAVRKVNEIINANRVSQVIRGAAPISEKMAVILEAITGVSALEWLARYHETTLPPIRAAVMAEIKARADQSAANASSVKAPK